MTNTKARNAELASVARAIAERHPEHVYQGGKLLPLAKLKRLLAERRAELEQLNPEPQQVPERKVM